MAAVIDPRFDIDEYLALARYMGVQIEHVLETHNHADHVSGHGRLPPRPARPSTSTATPGPTTTTNPSTTAASSSSVLRVRPSTLPAPSRALLVRAHRHARGPSRGPCSTGDTLFVGDIARPDLAVDKEDGARGIFHSLHEQLLAPPPGPRWARHLGGSLCGPGMDMKTSSTVGYELRHNELLNEEDEDRFVERVLATPGRPSRRTFKAVVELNRGPLLTAGGSRSGRSRRARSS